MSALCLALPAAALDLRPRLEGEGRWYPQADERPLTGSGAAAVEFFHDTQGWGRVAGEVFQRVDLDDGARTHGELRDLYYEWLAEAWELRAGTRRVFWGVTESRHLVDVVNQTDFVEDLDGETKLGQPMVELALVRPIGTVGLFLLPYPRARTFPGRDGRPRFPLPVAADQAQYESDDEQERLDAAIRYTGSFGPLDLGVAYFDGTARDPRLLACLQKGSGFAGTGSGPNCDIASAIPSPPGDTPLLPILQLLGLAPSDEEIAGMQAEFEANIRRNLVLVPHYDRLRQVSVDAQVVAGNLALKLEALRREQRGRPTWAAVTGFEYTFGDVRGTGADVGVLVEYLSDGMDDPLRRFDDELFAGGRLSLNDVAGTTLLAGAVLDRRSLEDRLVGIEGSRRLTDDWRLSLEARLFSAVPRGSPAAFLGDQDVVTVTLERFF